MGYERVVYGYSPWAAEIGDSPVWRISEFADTEFKKNRHLKRITSTPEDRTSHSNHCTFSPKARRNSTIAHVSCLQYARN